MLNGMSSWIIYSLRRGNRDPFYVGSTNDWRRRLKEHKAFFGKGITLDFLEEGIGARAERDASEHYWIEAFRQLGYKLANKTEGGDGGIETHSAETRTRLSEAMKGRIFTAEHREKIGKAHRGKIVSQETRAKLSEALRHLSDDPAFLEQQAEYGRMATYGKNVPVEERNAQLRAAYAEWVARHTEEERAAHRAKLSAARKRNISPEQRSALASLAAKARLEKDPGATGRQVRNWWASLSPEDREAYLARRTQAIRAAKLRKKLERAATAEFAI
jgi:uncharacterized protein YciI